MLQQSDSFNEAGNLFRRQGAMYENALSEKQYSDVALGTSSPKDHQRFSSPCPHEDSEDLKDQQDAFRALTPKRRIGFINPLMFTAGWGL